MTLAKRQLGKQGPQVSEIGLGCMGMSWAYGQPDDAESLRTLHRSVELGMNFWDTAEIYGPFKNEELLGRALKEIGRDRVTIATKFGWEFRADGARGELNSSPKHLRQALEGSLRRLGVDHVELYYQHRLDPKTPIEETVKTLGDLVREGKIGAIGLSEVGPETIKRAHAVHPISAVQSEYSLWERGVESHVLPLLRELGIGFVAYSPMGRGFLTGNFQSEADFPTGDNRLAASRFQGENLRQNLKLVELIKEFAIRFGATPAQIAIAWVTRRGEFIVPIPGTKRVRYLEQNAEAASLKIADAEWRRFEETVDQFRPAGERYAPAMLKLIDR